MSDYGVNFNNGSTGGEYSHTLSQQELPSFSLSGKTSWADLQGNFNSRNPAVHPKNNNGYVVNHGLAVKDPTGIVSKIAGYVRDGGDTGTDKVGYTAHINASHEHTFSISFNGSNRPHNNMQPFLTVYMWKRKA